MSTVNLFVHWLYTQVLPGPSSEDWARITQTEDTKGQPELIYIDAYVFGDRFVALEFRREIHEAFDFWLQGWYLWYDDSALSIATAYLSVPSHLPLRQQLVDVYCKNWAYYSHEVWGKDIAPAFSSRIQNSLPTAFLVRVMKTLHELRSKNTCEVRKMRCYIDHTLDADKEYCGTRHMHMKYDEEEDYGYFE